MKLPRITPALLAKIAGAIATAGLIFIAGATIESRTIYVTVDGDGNVVNARSPMEPQRCPKGWQDTSSQDKTHGVYVFSCYRETVNPDGSHGGWLVVLGIDGRSFNYAVPQEMPGAEIVFDQALVPDWTDER